MHLKPAKSRDLDRLERLTAIRLLLLFSISCHPFSIEDGGGKYDGHRQEGNPHVVDQHVVDQHVVDQHEHVMATHVVERWHHATRLKVIVIR